MKRMKKTIITLTCLGLALAGFGALQLNPAKNAKAEELDFACAGASIRLDSNLEDGIQTGIRFRVKMKTELLESVGENNVKVLVMPTDLIGEDGELNLEDTDAQVETLTDWRYFTYNDGNKDENYKQAFAYIYGMTEAEWNRPTTWRAYYMDGETPVYSDQMERSLSEVALYVKNDENETEKRKEMAATYILNYTYTYDYGVRDENGEWKKETYTFRYGDELSKVIPADLKPAARENFEFLAWQTTKGADKVKTTEDQKTILTGNVTKEAYWLLTGEINLDTPEKVAQYADLTQEMPRTEVVENSTGNGVAFKSGQEASTNIEYAHINWKNIVVNTDLNCRFKGYVTSAKRTTDGATGRTKVYFGNETTPIINVQNADFDEFATKDVSSFVPYGNEEGYYELADFSLMGANAVHVFQTATFEKFQIGATQVINTALSGNNTYKNSSWAWLGDAKDEGFNLISTSIYSEIKATVSDSYFACTATRAKQNGTNFFKVMLPSSSLKAGDKIVVKLKTVGAMFMGIESNGANTGSLLVNGGELNYVNATTTEASVKTGNEFGTAVYTVAKDISKYWLIFGASYGQTADVVIESIEIQTSTITTDVPQYLSGANEGAASVTLDNTGNVNQGVITGADNVKYAFVGASTWGKDALTFNFKNIALKAGDKIYLKATGTAATIKVNGTQDVAFDGDCDEVIFEVTQDMTLETLAFYVAEGDYQSIDFTLYKLYIERA